MPPESSPIGCTPSAVRADYLRASDER